MKSRLIKILLIILIPAAILVSKGKRITMPDSDGDTYFDKLERAAGTDPSKNECKPKKCPDASINTIDEAEHFIMILDQSGSMSADFGGNESRMEAAKRVVKDFIQNAPNDLKIGLYTYGKSACSAFDEMQNPFEKMDRKKLIEEVGTIQPSGSTPIGDSISKLTEFLSDKKGSFNVLLVTDGGESCNGNPAEEAKKLIELNKNPSVAIRLYIAGIGMSDEDGKELKQVATASQGHYIDIKNSNEMDKIFLTPIQGIVKSLKGMVCLQAEADELIRCESARLNKIKLVYPKKIDLDIPNEFTPDEKEFLKEQLPKLEEKTQDRIEKFMNVKAKRHEDYQDKIHKYSELIGPHKKKK